MFKILISVSGFICLTPPYREYSIWDNIEFFLMLISFAVLYVGIVYYGLYSLKLIINRIKEHFSTKL